MSMLRKFLKAGEAIRFTLSDGKTGSVTTKNRYYLNCDFPPNVKIETASKPTKPSQPKN